MLWKPLTKYLAVKKLKLPLQQVLVVPLVLQILTVGALTAWLSMRNAEQAISEVSSQLRAELTARINLQLKEYLEKPRLITQVNVNAAKLKQLNLQDKLALERFFAAQLLLFGSVSQIYFGHPDNTFVLTELQDDGSLTSRTTENSSSQGTYVLNQQGDRIRQITSQPRIDIYTRPWFKVAVAEKKLAWTPIYTLTKGELGITATQPFYDQTSKLVGVMAVDLLLGKISDFLHSLKISPTAQAFIIEPSGLLVASSTGEKAYTVELNKIKRLRASDSQNTLTRETIGFLNSYFRDFNTVKSSQQLDFSIDSKRQFVQVMPYKDQYGLSWLIVVVLPEVDFLEHIHANTRSTIFLCLIALLVSISIFILTAHWIALPVLKLKEASQEIAAGHLEQKVDGGQISELVAMASSFNKMARQLRKAFSDLEESNAYLSSILGNLKNGLLVTDLSDLISCINPAFTKMFGIGEAALIGQDFRDIVSAEVAELLEQSRSNPSNTFIVEVSLANGGIGQAIATGIRYEATDLPVSMTDYPTNQERNSDASSYIGVMILVRDITHEKEIDHLKNEFLSNISHELRTPLVSILGFTKIIDKKFHEAVIPLAELSTDKKTQKSIKQIKDNLSIVVLESEKLTALITNVLDITNLEASKVAFKMQILSIVDVIKQAVTNTEALFQDKQLPLAIDIPEDLPQVIGDQERLTQVVQHLITNAVNFTDQGRVTCQVKQAEQELIVSISDTGVGIDPSNHDLVFEKFKQVGDILTDKPQGSGLGLPICKAIISHHQGRMWLESELNKGTTFFFSLPIKS